MNFITEISLITSRLVIYVFITVRAVATVCIVSVGVFLCIQDNS